MLNFGVTRVDITPPVGTKLAGYGKRTSPSTGIHDPLYATVLYFLEDGGTQALLIILDIVAVDHEFTSELRRSIEVKMGIPKSAIMVCCTHTHAGPEGYASNLLRGVAAAESSLRLPTVSKLTEAVNSMLPMIRPVSLQIGSAKVDCICTNRNDPNRAIINKVDVLQVFDQKDLLAAIASYGCHPTVLDANNLLISSDFPGAARRHFEEHYPGSIFAFMNSGSGNASTRFTREGQDFNEVERMGLLFLDSVFNAQEHLFELDSASIRSKVKVIGLPAKELLPLAVAEQKLQDLRSDYRKMAAKSAAESELRVIETMIMGAEKQVEYSRQSSSLNSNLAEIQVIDFGDLRLIGIPGEPYSEVVEKILVGLTDKHTLVVSYANDYLGYFPTSGSEESYETLKSPWGANVGDIIAEECIKLAGEVLEL